MMREGEGGNIKPNCRELKFASWSGGQRILISVKLLPRPFVAPMCVARQELAAIEPAIQRACALLLLMPYNIHQLS